MAPLLALPAPSPAPSPAPIPVPSNESRPVTSKAPSNVTLPPLIVSRAEPEAARLAASTNPVERSWSITSEGSDKLGALFPALSGPFGLRRLTGRALWITPAFGCGSPGAGANFSVFVFGLLRAFPRPRPDDKGRPARVAELRESIRSCRTGGELSSAAAVFASAFAAAASAESASAEVDAGAGSEAGSEAAGVDMLEGRTRPGGG